MAHRSKVPVRVYKCLKCKYKTSHYIEKLCHESNCGHKMVLDTVEHRYTVHGIARYYT